MLTPTGKSLSASQDDELPQSICFALTPPHDEANRHTSSSPVATSPYQYKASCRATWNPKVILV
jgi:hypothetical protein